MFYFSLESTPSYVDWNWASRKDDLCLFWLLQSTRSYVDWNLVSGKDDLCFCSS